MILLRKKTLKSRCRRERGTRFIRYSVSASCEGKAITYPALFGLCAGPIGCVDLLISEGALAIGNVVGLRGPPDAERISSLVHRSHLAPERVVRRAD